MNTRIGGVFLLGLGLVSCGPAEPAKKSGGHHGHGAEASGATYAEGKGITFMDETRRVLGVEIADVGSKSIAPTISLTGQVYRAAGEPSRRQGGEQFGFAYAMVTLDPASADLVKLGQTFSFMPDAATVPLGGTVWKVVKTQLPVTGKVELLLQLPDSNGSLPVGSFFKASIPLGTSRETMAIPRAAVLTTSQGVFAYVQNGQAFLRTEIKLGAEDGEFVEVTSGLFEGDAIVVKPVEQLYLIELRAVKGGGHCH